MKISVHLATTTTRQDPGSCLQWAYTVDDTLHQQPMRTGHMTQGYPLRANSRPPLPNGVTQPHDCNGG